MHRMIIWLQCVGDQGANKTASSEFQIRLRSYHNDGGRAADGYCCAGAPNGDASGRCTDPCRTFFRLCLSHYTADIAPDQPCTFGLNVTDVLGNDSIDFRSDAAVAATNSTQTRGNSTSTIRILNPVRMPIRFTWPVSVSQLRLLIVNALI